MVALIGTIHSDACGNTRLNAAFQKLTPQSVSLEFPFGHSLHEYAFHLEAQLFERLHEIEKSSAEEWLKNFAIVEFKTYFYEPLFVHTYCRQKGIAVHCVDHPDLYAHMGKELPSVDDVFEAIQMFTAPESRRLYRQFPPSIGLIRESGQDLTKRWYQDPAQILVAFPLAIQNKIIGKFPIDLEMRETYIAEKVREAKADMHIGGLAHVFDCGTVGLATAGVVPLYKRIEDIVTAKYRLSDFD